MALSVMTKTSLQMAGFFGLTTFIVVYSICGIVSNIAISVLFGIFQFTASLYYGYITYKKENIRLKLRVFYGIVAAVSFISAMTNWCMHVKFFTEYTPTGRWFLVFFISLGISANASVPWTIFTEKYMKNIILSNGFDEFTEQLIYLLLNTIIIILQSSVMCSFGQITELEMVNVICLRSVGTTFCGIVVGAAFGLYLASKDDDEIGMIQPDEA